MPWTRAKYDAEVMIALAGKIGKEIAGARAEVKHGLDPTRYHEAAHAVTRWLVARETSFSVVRPDGSGTNSTPDSLTCPTMSDATSDQSSCPNDSRIVQALLGWAAVDGYQIDLDAMIARTRDLLTEHWPAVQDYARHLVILDGRISEAMTTSILEQHLGPLQENAQ